MPAETDLATFGNSLHQRLIAGDVTATAEIAELFFPLVIHRLRRRYPELDDPHLPDIATEEAILGYFARPEQYSPDKLSLYAYLCMSAKGDLLNLLKQRKVDADQLSLAEIVELDDSDTEYGVEIEADFDVLELVSNRISPIWQRLHDLLPNPVDQELVLLMMEGVRETSAYAQVLGISDHSVEEQTLAVKRHKDRLKKTLQRGIQLSELKEQ